MGVPTQLDSETALKRYDVLFRYLAYENTVFWTRSQFFVFANAGLLAGTVVGLLTDRMPATRAGILVLAALITAGIILDILWLTSLRKVNVWIARWERLCVELEPLAFGDQEVLRNPPETGIKSLALYVAWLFLALWLAAILRLAWIALN